MPSSCPQISPWLLYLPYILGGAFLVLVIAYKFSQRKTFLDKTKPPDNHQAEANDTTYGGMDLGYPVRVIVDRLPPSPSPPEADKAEHERTKKREKLKFYAEIFTVFLAAGLFAVTYSYTKYSYNMWCEMIRQNNLTQKNLGLSFGNELRVEKSGIGLHRFNPPPPQTTYVVVQFQSQDDRPVTNVSGQVDMDFLANPPRMPYKISGTYNAEDDKCKKPSVSLCHFDIEKSLSADAYREFLAGNRNFYVWGHITYIDRVQGPRSFDFCKFVSAKEVNETTKLPYLIGFPRCYQ